MTFQFTPKVTRDLKFVSGLSSKKRWEYGGRLKYDKQFNYTGLTMTTSKERAHLGGNVLKSPISYHTHPGILKRTAEDANWDIFTTLPSNSDLELYIKAFPILQVNIICDMYGFYIIDIFEAVKRGTLPVPKQVHAEMTTVRYEDFLYRRSFAEDRLEYFYTSLPEWKTFINTELCPRLMELYGVSIKFYGYEDELPSVILDM